MSDKRLIVGLGNPGQDYTLTRHNMGFLVAERIADTFRLRFKSGAGIKALVAQGRIRGVDVFIMMPHTFMNCCGPAVKQLMKGQEISQENLLVICDDFSLNFGQLRIRSRGSDGGHNGLKSIVEHLGTQDFVRLRVGIGPVPPQQSSVDFVLEMFKPAEKKELPGIVQTAADCCQDWISEDMDLVMNRYNQTKDAS